MGTKFYGFYAYHHRAYTRRSDSLRPILWSGTTGIAALRLKRQFIGIDIDPQAIEAAKANLTLSLQQQQEHRHNE